MNAAGLRRMRLAYSPLVEVAESLCVINQRQVPGLYRVWFDQIRGRLRHVDMPLLRAAVRPGPDVARFMFAGAAGPGTSIERQLRLVAACPAEGLRQDLAAAWPAGLPPAARRLLAGGPGRLAEELWTYWQIAIGPYWAHIRAVLDADVAYRAARLAEAGIEGLLAGLNPRLTLRGHAIEVGAEGPVTEHDLSGTGLLLVPCAFAWPYLDVGVANHGPPHLIYGARGVGNLWQQGAQAAPQGPAVLGELLGRSRAAILISVAVPMSTTALARTLGQKPPAVSAHLSVLRRSALITSRRSGRQVLYQQTPLAASIISATAATSHQAPTPPRLSSTRSPHPTAQ